MLGKILKYDMQAGGGLISGDDGQRYNFVIAEWKDGVQPYVGQPVDFEAADGQALQIYKLAGQTGLSGDKNKIVAALLAFFLGALGIHKFYLGYNTAGIIMLLVTLFSWVLLFVPLLIISVIAFIEFIIYLVTSDEEFEQKYVVGHRPWF